MIFCPGCGNTDPAKMATLDGRSSACDECGYKRV